MAPGRDATLDVVEGRDATLDVVDATLDVVDATLDVVVGDGSGTVLRRVLVLEVCETAPAPGPGTL
jgi:hypothetical protein